MEKHTPIDALKHIFGKKIEKTETHEINFRCSCSHQKALESLKLLKVDELKEIIIKNEIVEVSCKWCSTTYKIKPEEVKKILEEKNK